MKDLIKNHYFRNEMIYSLIFIVLMFVAAASLYVIEIIKMGN